MPVTYSQVEAAANTLVSLGKKATVRAVRDQVGGGANFNEFMVHLDVWKEKGPAKPVQQPQLPPSRLLKYCPRSPATPAQPV